MVSRRRIAGGILALGVLAPVALRAFPARAQRADIWTLKVAFIEKIASFLEWPEEAGLEDPERPFIWTFYGRTPLQSRAVEVFREHRFLGHTVILRAVNHPKDVAPTHLLFIAHSAKNQLPSLFEKLGDQSVLTVSDYPGMAQHGVAVNLYRDEGKLRFEVNRRALRRARIRASFRLLALARIVDEARR